MVDPSVTLVGASGLTYHDNDGTKSILILTIKFCFLKICFLISFTSTAEF